MEWEKILQRKGYNSRRSTQIKELDTQVNPRNRRLHISMLLIYVVFWCVTAFSPVDRWQWAIENLLPLATVLTLILTYKKFTFSSWSYLWILLFLCLHLYAAHYTYEKTPVDQWLKAAFHTKRSYFDRVVHFTFGLIWTYPFREILLRISTLRGFWSYFIPLAVNVSFSAAFELIEAFVAMIGGQVGIQYLGLQGDPFDTQKDMGSALLGAVLSIGLLVWMSWRKQQRMTRA